MTRPADAIVGCILAGGRSSRMGGLDKPLMLLDGKTLIERTFARLAPQVASVAISSNAEPSLFAAFPLPVLADPIPGFQGPLAGVLASLEWAAASDFASVVTVASDTPFFPLDLVARLQDAARQQGTDLACAASDGRRHPVFALWPTRLASAVRRALSEDRRGVDAFLSRHRPAIAEFPAAPYDPFFNLNRPADLAAAEAVIREHGA